MKDEFNGNCEFTTNHQHDSSPKAYPKSKLSTKKQTRKGCSWIDGAFGFNNSLRIETKILDVWSLNISFYDSDHDAMNGITIYPQKLSRLFGLRQACTTVSDW